MGRMLQNHQVLNHLRNIRFFFKLKLLVATVPGVNLLHYAAVSSDSCAMLTLLLENIKEKCNDLLAYINARDRNGDTPLMWAVTNRWYRKDDEEKEKHCATAKLLISVGNVLFKT